MLISSLDVINAQCLPNTPLDSTVHVFDWRTEYFDMYLKNETQQSFSAQVSLPFFITNNSAQFNTDHFAESLELDFYPEDGWEAVYTNFGTDVVGVAVPSFALYNRYTGIISIESKYEIKSYTLYNLNRKILKHIEGQRETINISEFAQGVYLVKVHFKNGIHEIAKIVKI